MDTNRYSLSQIGEQLQADMIDALTKDPAKIIVSTPAFPSGSRWTAVEVIEDQCSGAGNTDFAAMLQIVAQASKSTDPALRLPAQALIASMALQYAKLHQDDAELNDDDAQAGKRKDDALTRAYFAYTVLPRVSRS